MNVARIKAGVVVNIEIADQEWIDSQDPKGGFIFIEDPENQPAHIGLAWNPDTGFEQPSIEELTHE